MAGKRVTASNSSYGGGVKDGDGTASSGVTAANTAAATRRGSGDSLFDPLASGRGGRRQASGRWNRRPRLLKAITASAALQNSGGRVAFPLPYSGWGVRVAGVGCQTRDQRKQQRRRCRTAEITGGTAGWQKRRP